VPVLLAGLAATATGLALGSRRSVRTRYRPDPWALPEWLTAGSGLAVAALVTWLAGRDPGAFTPSVVPPTAPVLPLAAALAALVGLLPAFAAPDPLGGTARDSARADRAPEFARATRTPRTGHTAPASESATKTETETETETTPRKAPRP
jgi:energy-coupling factor transport system permease protein